MKQVIDAEPSTANWTVSGAQTKRDVQIAEYIAGIETTQSMITTFYEASDYVERVFGTPIDVSDYDYLVFSVWSHRNRGGQFRRPEDFNYGIVLQDGGAVLSFPTWQTFTEVVIDISGIDQIDKLRIEPLRAFESQDHLIVSNFVVCTPDYPYDILQGIREHLLDVRSRRFPQGGVKAGTVTASQGDTQITIDGLVDYVERYSVVRIAGGGNEETHLLINNNETDFELGGLYDGDSLLHDYTDADVYVLYEPILGKFEEEAVIPSITVWGFSPDSSAGVLPASRTVKEYGGGTFTELQTGMRMSFPIQLDIYARHWQLIEEMGDMVREFLAGRELWINGRKHDFIWQGGAETTFPDDPTVQLYSVTYNLDVEVKEARVETLPKHTTTTTSFTVEKA
jgi:hypothetical protein